MTVAPEPNQQPQNPAQPQAPRPDLRLVPPPETATEITGPIPVVGDEPAGTESPVVAPQAPLDVRVLSALGEFLNARPRWSERPPSMAETWEYSTTGDWTTDEKSVKRIPHGICVLVAFAVTYPIAWVCEAARRKPIGFVLGIAVLFVLSQAL